MSLVRVHNFAVSLDGIRHWRGTILRATFRTRWKQAPRPPPGHSHVPQDAWRAGREHRRRRGLRQQLGDGYRCRDYGPQQIWAQRGPWADEEWKGWWGDDPVFHAPVFVLTHHPRPTIHMKGNTTFHFIEASPIDALRIAREAAGELDVRIGGGPSTVR